MLVLILGVAIADAVHTNWARQNSGVVGAEWNEDLSSIERYMRGDRPATPEGIDRVGVVVKTDTKIEPWPSQNKSRWHVVFYTLRNDNLEKVDAWVYDNPLEVSKRVHIGDYIAVMRGSNRPDSMIYPSSAVLVLEVGAVGGLPRQE
jgi:hypothetical protein